MDRRQFLKYTALGAGSIPIALSLSSCNQRSAGGANGALPPWAWLEFRDDGGIVLSVALAEMGQAVHEAMAILVARELMIEAALVSVRQAPVESGYGSHYTGGSASIRKNYSHYQGLGAAARELFASAASSAWNVDRSRLDVKHARVYHPDGNESLSFSELIPLASKLPVPEHLALRPIDSIDLLQDASVQQMKKDHLHGRSQFGIDVYVENQQYVIPVRISFENGDFFQDVQTLINPQQHPLVETMVLGKFLLIIGPHYWAVFKAYRQLQQQVKLATQGKYNKDTESMYEDFRQQFKHETATYQHGPSSSTPSSRVEEFDFDFPFLAHLPMEVLGCVCQWQEGRLHCHLPTQVAGRLKQKLAKAMRTGPSVLLAKVAEKLGLDYEDDNIQIHPYSMGCSFGRRLYTDYAELAMDIAVRTGKNIKMIWPREEDVRNDLPRPASSHRFSLHYDGFGGLLRVRNQLAGPAIGRFHDGNTEKADKSVVRGLLENQYNWPAYEIRYHNRQIPVAIGAWRSVSLSSNVYTMEVMADVIARRLGMQALSYRRQQWAMDKRMDAVLQRMQHYVASRSHQGCASGFAVCAAYDSYIAVAASVQPFDSKRYQVLQLHYVCDAGKIIHRQGALKQIEGGALFALSAFLGTDLPLQEGKLPGLNFDQLKPLRMHECPEISIEFIDSQESPGGLGELAVPPLGPAIANAIAACAKIDVVDAVSLQRYLV